jgi:hypothetical protein
MTTNGVKAFNSLAPKTALQFGIPAHISAPFQSASWTTSSYQVPSKVKLSADEDVHYAAGKLANNPNVAYAYFEAVVQLQLENSSGTARRINGWEFINLVCLQEMAVDNGLISIFRLRKRICNEFPTLQEPVGDKVIEIFVYCRSLNELAAQLDLAFANATEWASWLIYENMRSIQKDWPLIQPD